MWSPLNLQPSLPPIIIGATNHIGSQRNPSLPQLAGDGFMVLTNPSRSSGKYLCHPTMPNHLAWKLPDPLGGALVSFRPVILPLLWPRASFQSICNCSNTRWHQTYCWLSALLATSCSSGSTSGG